MDVEAAAAAGTSGTSTGGTNGQAGPLGGLLGGLLAQLLPVPQLAAAEGAPGGIGLFGLPANRFDVRQGEGALGSEGRLRDALRCGGALRCAAGEGEGRGAERVAAPARLPACIGRCTRSRLGP
jgi:hypothetical protein